MNGAFRPKGGNEVHGLFDDVGMPEGQGVLAGDGSSPLPGTPPSAVAATSPYRGGGRKKDRINKK